MSTEQTTTAQATQQPGTAAGARTLNTLFLETARKHKDRVALRRKKAPGVWEDISWKAYEDAVRRAALGLAKLGLKASDRAAILSNSRVEWAIADMAILAVGAVAVPIYQSVREDEVGYVLADSGARVVFVEDLEQLAKVAKARGLEEHGGLKKVEKAIVFDSGLEHPRPGDAGPPEKKLGADLGLPEGFALSLAELDALGADGSPEAFEKSARAANQNDLVTLIYTSGTTGKPKGVMLTQGNAVAQCDALAESVHLSPDDVVLTFLPLAHIFARAVHWLAWKVGFSTAYTSIATILDDMKDVRPMLLPAVPRFFEKVHAAVMQKIEAESPFKRRYVKAALRWELEGDRCRREGRPIPAGLGLKRILGRPVIKKLAKGLREKTGGRLRRFISGGAPLSKEIAEFFHALGFLILEAYGLTETTGGTHVNRSGRYKLGTVGPTVPGLEMKIAEDGEILVRGPIIMQGYYNRPEATKEVLDGDGWFRTGDIGEVDGDGFLRITDRKKDLIKTAGGKYVAPQNIENLMKTIPGVSQFAVFGDQKKYCVALVTVDPKERATDQSFVKQLGERIAEKNAQLASWETVKYFRIVPKDFEIGDELTPTLKVKRKHVAQKYKDLIEEMYAEKNER